MKTNFLFVFVFAVFSVFSQNRDSLIIDSLIRRNLQLSNQGHFDEAMQTILLAKEKIKDLHGELDFYFASALILQGRTYYLMGRYQDTERLYLEGIRVWEKISGQDNPYYAKALNNLGLLYKDQGRYLQAEKVLLKAKAIRERVYSKEHVEYAQALDNLAFLYEATGDFGKMEAFILESKEIRAKTQGKSHSDYATSLYNLATLHSAKGDYQKAEQFFLEVKEIWEKTLGKKHPLYARLLTNLAEFPSFIGNHPTKEALYLEAKEIRAKFLGMEHPEYAMSLEDLAALAYRKGDFAKADSLYLEAKNIYVKSWGKEHPQYAHSLDKLGFLSLAKGDFFKAEKLYQEAKDLREKILGKGHQDYIYSLENLVNVYTAIGEFKKAVTFYLEMIKPHREFIEQSAAYSSERQMIAYLPKFERIVARLLSFAQLYYSSELVGESYDNMLFINGYLLENSRRLAQVVAASDSLTRDMYDQWQGCRRRLSSEYTKPIANRQNIPELEDEAERFEKDLTRRLPYLDASRQTTNWQEIKDHLQPTEAAVEFVHYRYYINWKSTDSVMYAALVLRPDWNAPIMIPLFEKKQLESYFNSTSERKPEYIDALYSIAERGVKNLVTHNPNSSYSDGLYTPDNLNNNHVGKPKKSLYNLLWQPLEKHLASVSTIYYSPSGLLHRLNLAAIPIGLDSALADRHHFVELGSTRQLVIPNEHKPAANDALLFGGIEYEADSTALAQANAALDSISIASRGELSFAYTDSTLRTGAWSALPFTDREVSSVEKTLKSAGFQSKTRKGYAATEEAFKTIGAGGKPSPRVLHIATHGFFFPDPKSERERSERVSGEREPVFKISDHPMIRSGLILAGGNHAWKTGKPVREDLEDGILTAYEISQMNLSNTELVVLSACETGLGDIQGNEGVYGLQRAFKIAGAKYLIMSLWQVPDKQTSLLMTTFYKKWLEEKMAIPEAFRAAQRELREAGLDPYQWAGFVLVE